MALTRFLGLSKLGPASGRDFSSDGYQHVWADRDKVDLILWVLLHHNHDPDTTELIEPDEPVALDLDDTQGALPSGSLIYYKQTFVDEFGMESAPGPEAFIQTADPLSAPQAPTLARGTVGGQLRPGSYFYAVSAWKGADTLESELGGYVTTTLPANGGSTQRIAVTLPDLPPGADGFNLYRRIPGSPSFHHLATIDAADADDVYDDLGTVEADCERLGPTRNTSGESNTVTVTLPDEVPPGLTWRLYRSFDPGDWTGSLLADVVETTTDTSGIITTTFVDTGGPVTAGSPPLATTSFPHPPAIEGGGGGGPVEDLKPLVEGTTLTYYRDRGRTWLGGAAAIPSLTPGDPAQVGVLPDGYRPVVPGLFNVLAISDDGLIPAGLVVEPSGEIMAFAPGGSTDPVQVSLEGISFRALILNLAGWTDPLMADNPLAFWPMQDSDPYEDLVAAAGLALTLSGGATPSFDESAPGPVDGIVGKRAAAIESWAYVNYDAPIDYGAGGVVTIEWWAFTPNAEENQAFQGGARASVAGATGNFQIRHNASQVRIEGSGYGAGYDFSLPAGHAAAGWHHYSATVGSAAPTLMIDGTQAALTAPVDPPSFVGLTGAGTIGLESELEPGYQVSMCSLAVFPGALSPSQRTAHYQAINNI